MEPNTIDQILNLVDKSQNILLITHAKADCDGLGAMLAASTVFKELGKRVTAVSNDPAPENLSFLPAINIVQGSLGSNDFIITLDLSKTPLSKLKYNLEDKRVNIIITPKYGSFSPQDVSFGKGDRKFDLIIVFDAGNLEHLGPIYDKNAELFFEIPVINIDHHASNTDFGRVNLVDVVAASTTEILFGVLQTMEKKYNKKLITEDVATLLLAGIITDTGSFQHANTSPRSMEAAARLLNLGARQQEIIKNIYKTKKLSTLKLWGLVLSKVQVDPLYRMVWSTISQEDLKEAGATADESEGVIDGLLSNAPGAEVFALMKQNPDYISVSLRSNTNAVDVNKIATEMGGGGHVRAAGYKVRGQPFDEVVGAALAKIRQYQKERLNIHEENLPKEPPALKPQPKPAEPAKAETGPSEPARAGKTTYLEFKAPPPQPKKQEQPKPTQTQQKSQQKQTQRPQPKPEKPSPNKAEGKERGKQPPAPSSHTRQYHVGPAGQGGESKRSEAVPDRGKRDVLPPAGADTKQKQTEALPPAPPAPTKTEPKNEPPAPDVPDWLKT
ncbi:DHH family phosphoesterase [Candidatus Peregrinibacteria bacterium]|nr:DHH family phosphoesterase [Candidatus Peregrinibacteria bacterium]